MGVDNLMMFLLSVEKQEEIVIALRWGKIMLKKKVDYNSSS